MEWEDSIYAVALGASDEKGILLPNEEGSVVFFFTSTNSSGVTIEFATIDADSELERLDAFSNYPEYTKAISEAVTDIAPTLKKENYDHAIYFDYAYRKAIGLPYSRLSGVLTDKEFKSIRANEDIWLTNQNGEIVSRARTDDDGYFLFTEVDADFYTLGGNDFEAVDPALFAVENSLHISNVQAQPKSRVYGSVKNDLGTPVAGAKITVYVYGKTTAAISDINGSYVIYAALDDEVLMICEDPNKLHMSGSKSVLIDDDGSISLKCNIVLPRAGVIRGDLLVSGNVQDVSAVQLGFSNTSDGNVFPATVFEDGTYICNLLPPGNYKAVIYDGFGFDMSPPIVDVSAGGIFVQDIVAKVTSDIVASDDIGPVGTEISYALRSDLSRVANNYKWDINNDGIIDSTNCGRI